MTIYSDLISKATGIRDSEKLNMIESYMRHIYFHSTLNWQELEVLQKAAKESAKELAQLGWNFR